MPNSRRMMPYEYDVAISYASEQRDAARRMAEYFQYRGLRPFFAEFEAPKLLGEDMHLAFTEVFLNQSRSAIAIVSEAYVAKIWPRQEFAAIRAAMIERGSTYLVPVRADDTLLPGLLPTINYADLRLETPEIIAAKVCAKFFPDLPLARPYEVPAPIVATDRDTVTFDYTDHTGKYRIGTGAYEFETHWSPASGQSIHCYADTPTVIGVALAPPGAAITDIGDARALNYTSRHRTVGEGEVVVVQNNHGFFAAIRVADVKDKRYDERDEVTIEFVILKDATADFSRAT